MAEQTTAPVAPVAQEAPTDEQRMARFLDQYEREQSENAEQGEQTEAAPAEQAQAPESQAQSDELTPEDLPDEGQPAQLTGEALEIVHNGTTHKVSRDEAIKLAQQGFDYTQKTQIIAESARDLQTRLAKLDELEQVYPLIAQEAAQVAALEAQLKPYNDVDWVKLATDDPLSWSRYQAQYNQLLNSYNTAKGSLDHKQGAVKQYRQQITAQNLQQEMQRLVERVPEWRDQAKFQQGAAEVRQYLVDQGAQPAAVDSLSDALSVTIARKAMLYDKLLKAKTEKVKQLRTIPPVARPNSVQASAAKADKATEAMQRLRKSGSTEDAVATLLAKM